jgi:hypothetical protein
VRSFGCALFLFPQKRKNKNEKENCKMGAIVFFWIICIAVILIIDWFAAKEFESIAAMKGYTSKKYFWWTFLLAIYGIPMIIALPDRNSSAKSVSTQNDDLPEI